MTHVYGWRNNPLRARLYGRPCVIEARGRMNTILVRFTDGRLPERVTTSRHAVRPVVYGACHQMQMEVDDGAMRAVQGPGQSG